MKRNTMLTIFLSGIFLICLLLICLVGQKDNAISQAVSSSANQRAIIIDAGHGGVDGGAVSSGGIVEKHINLSIALKLKMLCEMWGYRVIMTREDDVSIHDSDAVTVRAQKASDLHNRLKIADENPQAILISIHQNQYQSASSKGMQVFHSSNDLKSVDLAENIQNFTTNNLLLDNKRKIKPITKSVYLIYNAKQPAVLVECGFLSNPKEAENLNNEGYQKKLALCIFGGITNYYK